MKHFQTTVRRGAFACLLATFAFTGSLFAQQPAKIGNISFDDLPSPDVQTGKSKSFRPKDWLEVETGITIPPQNATQKDSGFLDRVMVKWYVAVKEKASGKPMLMTKDVNHINVPVDEEIYSSVYISPNTLKRITGSDRAGKRAVEVVGLEVFVDGVKVGVATSSMQEGWWSSPSLSRGDRYPLLNKNETPFKMFWWDRYAEIEEERR